MPPAAPATPQIGYLPTFALVFATAGVGVGATALLIHHRIATSQSVYTSFCDISERLSCDTVLGSAYASVLGIPVAGWAILSYVAAFALALALSSTRGDARLRVAAMFAGLTGSIAAISVYFFAISTVVIGVACPLCLAMDGVNLGLLVVAILIVRSLRPSAPQGWPARRFWFASSTATLGLLALLTVVQFPRDAGSVATSVEDVQEDDPRFYAWYVSQPISDAAQGEVRHAEGSSSPAITVVEYSDFECPHCGHAFFDLNRALGGAKDVRLIYRHFPLNSDCNPEVQTRVHSRACQAAVAAECAGAQGKFWEYHKLLFEHQDALDPPSLLGYAARLSLDQGEFERCLASPAAAAAVAADVAAGAAAGVSSTPTFFINGRRIAGSLRGAEQYRYALTIERAHLTDAGSPQTAKP
jgi:protein-disulfide isomerase/uncharacterized membrane protein